ncbi:MAG: porin family protein [Bacteroidetes bacterium]|nr:porin family protein [Bacteroidota bacterium]
MKFLKIILIGVFITTGIFSEQIFAQKRPRVLNLPKFDLAPYHFGFSLNVNQMFFTIKPATNMQKKWYYGVQQLPDLPNSVKDTARVLSLESLNTFGFTIGIVSNLRLGTFFDLRFVPDLAFGERELVYIVERHYDGTVETVGMRKTVYSTLVDIPLHIKYKSKRYNNTRAYLLAGLKYSIDLASEAKKNQDELDNKHVRLKKNDLYFEAAVGFDFYTTYFKFGTEFKMSYGLNDILIREDNIYTSSIDRLTSKIFQLSFTFE